MKRIIICLMAVCLAVLWSIPCPVSAKQVSLEAGGIHLLKTDLTGNVLGGASFQLLREPEEGELTDSSREKKMVKIGQENRIMVVEKFWNDRKMTGDLHTIVTTDRAGKAAIYGLPYGTYYLLETKAPEGYNRITEPIRISIHRFSHLTKEDRITDDEGILIDNTLHIINVRYTLPDTGNLGLLQLMAAGTGILFSSIALLLLNWRRWR